MTYFSREQIESPLSSNHEQLTDSTAKFLAQAYGAYTQLRSHPTPIEAYSQALQIISDKPFSMPPLTLTDNSSTSPTKIDKPGNYSETVMVDGIPRHYQLHVPPNYDQSKPMPLVIVLHGHGQDGSDIEKAAGIDAKADKEGFIVAYPDATRWFGNKQLSAWDTDNGLVPPGADVDDVGFLNKVIDNSQSQLSVDQKRTYLVGVSNGGMMAYKAAAELSDKIAAVVDISGAMSGTESKPNSPVSVLSIVGTADGVVPPSGRTKMEEAAAASPDILPLLAKAVPSLKEELNTPLGQELVQKLAIKSAIVPQFQPVDYATDFWRSADGISASSKTTQNGAITTETYTNSDGVTVEQKIVAGADHVLQHDVPSGFNLADETWNFLEAHPKVS